MPRVAEYLPVHMMDKEERDRVIAAGDSNFFDATKGFLYIKKSSLAKYGVKERHDFHDTFYSKHDDLDLWFDYKRDDNIFSYTEDRKAILKEEIRATAKKLGVKVVVRMAEDFHKPVPPKSVVIYTNHFADRDRNKNTFRLHDINYNRPKSQFFHPLIGGVCDKPMDGVYVLKDKIVLDCVSYDGNIHYGLKFAFNEYAEKATKMKALEKADSKDVLEGLLGIANLEIDALRATFNEQLKHHKQNERDYTASLLAAINGARDCVDKLKLTKKKEVDDLPIHKVSVAKGKIVYHLKPFKHKGVVIKPIKVWQEGANWLTEPEDDKLKAPAPWLWWDEEKKNYTGYIDPALAATVKVENGILNIINILVKNSNLDTWPGYKDRYDNFVKESEGENGEGPEGPVLAEGVAKDVPVLPVG